ncbi:hypothetical protein FVE85_5887 [Porphyridium purpureum]|uniref:Uncharacterized protein n=1 Tax=Porphyridium purpureum TaxID=35688 RepID=A0A5J4Z556_PORPP|nr:hypothetical protein FVE85_5887 [Porphyridium purpureum]|eukprot:POR9884..scf295_1
MPWAATQGLVASCSSPRLHEDDEEGEAPTSSVAPAAGSSKRLEIQAPRHAATCPEMAGPLFHRQATRSESDLLDFDSLAIRSDSLRTVSSMDASRENSQRTRLSVASISVFDLHRHASRLESTETNTSSVFSHVSSVAANEIKFRVLDSAFLKKVCRMPRFQPTLDTIPEQDETPSSSDGDNDDENDADNQDDTDGIIDDIDGILASDGADDGENERVRIDLQRKTHAMMINVKAKTHRQDDLVKPASMFAVSLVSAENLLATVDAQRGRQQCKTCNSWPP